MLTRFIRGREKKREIGAFATNMILIHNFNTFTSSEGYLEVALQPPIKSETAINKGETIYRPRIPNNDLNSPVVCRIHFPVIFPI